VTLILDKLAANFPAQYPVRGNETTFRTQLRYMVCKNALFRPTFVQRNRKCVWNPVSDAKILSHEWWIGISEHCLTQLLLDWKISAVDGQPSCRANAKIKRLGVGTVEPEIVHLNRLKLFFGDNLPPEYCALELDEQTTRSYILRNRTQKQWIENTVGYNRKIIIINRRITGISEMRDRLCVITYKEYFLFGWYITGVGA